MATDFETVVERYSPEASQSYSLNSRSSMLHVADLICGRWKLGEGSRVLDLGCRGGENALSVARSTGAQVVGVDRDAEQVRRAIRASRELEPPRCNAQFFVERPEALPFSADSFDVIYCDRFLNTVGDAQVVASEMQQMVKPSGSVVVVDLYLRRENALCERALRAWQGDVYLNTALSDTITLFERQGLSLMHFEPFDGHLASYVESMIWRSLLESSACPSESWGSGVSRDDACDLLRAIDEREIGYAAMVFERDV